jgi:hypothetical protein
MSNISVKLGVANPKVVTVLNFGSNPAQTIGDSQYFPITIEAAQADITASVIPVATQSRLNAVVAGAFDKVRVGDFLDSVATGSLTAKAAVTVSDAYLASGLKEISYDETFNSANLGVKSGDVITVAAAGTGIPSNTIVTKIDYANRKIYVDKVLTETKIANVTVPAPRIRVTAVRKSTAVTNANQIDFDSTVATTGVAGDVTIAGGAVDAVFTVFRFTPIDSTVDAKATLSISSARLDGTQVVGSTEGFNGLDYTALNYNNNGQYQTDLDTFRTLAGVAAPV